MDGDATMINKTSTLNTTADLATVAQEIREAHKSRIRTNLSTAIDIGGKLLNAKQLCKIAREKWMPWVEANCEVKQAMADRYMALHKGTTDKTDVLEHILKEQMGIESAYQYVCSLKPKSQSKAGTKPPAQDSAAEDKKTSLTINQQIGQCRQLIRDLSVKIQKKLPEQEWEDYLTDLDARPMSEYFTGKSELPLPPSLEKTIRQPNKTEEFRPSA
jgi:hypothetical protein